MNNFRNRADMVQIQIEAPHSYQIKRIMKALEKVKGLRMMSTSGVYKKRCTKNIVRCCSSFEDTKTQKH